MYAESVTRKFAVAAFLVTVLAGMVAAGVQSGPAGDVAGPRPALTGQPAAPVMLPEVVVTATRLEV